MNDPTCPSCGAVVEENTRFCPNCGARMPAPAATDATITLPPLEQEIPPTQRLEPPPPPVALPAPTTTTPRRNSQLWLILGGVGCLAIVLLIACAGLVLIGTQEFARLEPIDSPPDPVVQPSPVSGAGGIVPDDSLIAGGNLLLRDDFTNPETSDLAVSEDESSRYAYVDGGYEIEVIEPDLIAWTMLGGSFSSMVVECDTAVRPGSELVAAGIIFHYQDDQNFFLFRVSNDGYYSLDLLQDDEWVTLIDWTESDAIDAVNNQLRVETFEDQISLFVNNVLVDATEDGTFTRGEVGLAVSSFEQGQAIIRFDNLLITKTE